MSCYLNYRPSVTIPSNSILETSKAALEPFLRQYVPPAPGEQQMEFVRQAQASASFLAERHMSPALLKRVTPQAGNSTTLQSRYVSPLPLLVGRSRRQEVQRLQPDGQSPQKHPAHHGQQQCHVSQDRQQHRTRAEPSQILVPRSEDNQRANNPTSTGNIHLEKIFATAIQTRDQHAQQGVGSVACGSLPLPIQQMHQLKGAYTGNNAHESSSHHAYSKFSECTKALSTEAPAGALRVPSSGVSRLENGALSSALQQHAAPSCSEELSHIPPAYQSTHLPSSHQQITPVNSNTNTRDHTVSRGNRTVLLSCLPSSSGRERFCEPQFAAATAYLHTAKPHCNFLPGNATADHLTAAAEIGLATAAPGGLKKLIMSQAATGSASGKARREKSFAARSEVGAEVAESGIRSPSKSCPAPRQQSHASQRSLQALRDVSVGKLSRVAYSPPQHRKEYLVPQVSGGLRDSGQAGRVLAQSITAGGSLGMHATGARLLRERESEGAEHGTNPNSFCSSVLSHVRSKAEEVQHHQQQQQDRQQSSARTVALEFDVPENPSAYASMQSPETKFTSASQGLTGFASVRPRTPVRVPVVQCDHHWHPQRQPLVHPQPNAQQASRFRQQMCLQQRLGQLQGQHPYKWAAPGGLGRQRAPGMMPQSVTKFALFASQPQSALGVYASILPNAFTPTCCWQPHASRGGGTGVLRPSVSRSVAHNRLDGVLFTNETTPIHIKTHWQNPLDAVNNKCKKRPTSAPPSQNDRFLQGGLGAVLHQDRALMSSVAQLVSQKGPQFQSHQILKGRCNQVGGPVSGSQTLSVVAVPAHASKDCASSLKPTVNEFTGRATAVGLAKSAVCGGATVTAVSMNSTPTRSSPEFCSAQEKISKARLRRPFEPEAQLYMDEGELTVPDYPGKDEQFPVLSGSRTKASPVQSAAAMAVPRLGANEATAPLQSLHSARPLDFQNSLHKFTNQKQADVPGEAGNNKSGDSFQHATRPIACDLMSMTMEQTKKPSMLFRQNVGISTSSNIVCRTAESQKDTQLQKNSSSQKNPCGRTSDDTGRLIGQIGQLCEDKHARNEVHQKSEGCDSSTQRQERSQQHANHTHPHDILRRVEHQHRHPVEEVPSRQQPDHNLLISEHQRERQTPAMQRRHDGTESRAVASADRTPAIDDLQQGIASAPATGKEHLKTGRSKQLSSERAQKTPHRQRRFLSCVEASSLSSTPSTPETPGRSSSMGVPVLSRPKEEELLKQELQTSFESVSASASQSTAQGATGDASVPAQEAASRRSTSGEIPVHIDMMKASSTTQKTSVTSASGKDNSSGEAGLQLLQRHGQWAGHALSGEDVGRCSATIVANDRSRDVYARSSVSTVGSKGSAMGSGCCDKASKCSRASSMSRASSCHPIARCSTRPKTRRRESSAHNSIECGGNTCNKRKGSNCLDKSYADLRRSEGKQESALQQGVKDRTASSARENTYTDESSRDRGDQAHAESTDDQACGARTHMEENPFENERENGDNYMQVRARCSSDNICSETVGHPEEKVERNRLRSITSTDVSRHTGRSTTTSNEHTALSDDSNADAYREGEEDVIPLPAFLWRSPLSLHISAEDHTLFPETACTATCLRCRPDRFRNSSRFNASLHDKDNELMPALMTRKCGRAEQSTHLDGGGNLNTATLQMADFELADPRFGGEASLLGRGTYGIARLMRHKPTGRLYAVKSIEKSSVVEAGMVSQVEFELLTQKDILRHRNILRCYAFLEDVDRVHMVLEYCNGGDLYTRIRSQPQRRINEEEAFLYFAQLVNGLHYMHTRCIMHRDLKLENLLLDKDGVLKIADLGWCTTILGKRRSFNFCGTLDYLAPEMVRGDGHDWRVDIWGAGILLYEMLDGKPPFQSTRHLELVQQILKAKINLPPHISPDAGDLIEQLLQYDPENRIPLHAICQHPWVKRMWNQLKKHYYSVYPNAAPSAFDLCLPALAARQQIEDALSKTSVGRKPGVDLQHRYTKETAMAPIQESDTVSKIEKSDGSPPPPVNGAQPSSDAVSSQVSLARDIPPALEFATSTVANFKYAANAGLYSAVSTDAAGGPACRSETPAGAIRTESTGDNVPSAPCKTVVYRRQAAEAGDGKIGRSSTTSLSRSRSSLQQQRGRTVTHVSKSKQRENSTVRPSKMSGTLMAVCPVKERNIGGGGKVTKTRRESTGSRCSSEHSVSQEEENAPLYLSKDRCSIATNLVQYKKKGCHALACSAAESENKRNFEPIESISGAAASPASPAISIKANPITLEGKGQWASPRPAGMPLSSTSAKAATPPAVRGRASSGLRTRTLVRDGTGAAIQRSSTAASEFVLEAVRAATPGASMSRIVDRAPRRTTIVVEGGDGSKNSLSKSKEKCFFVASRPRVFQQSSKIDSGLGSQKNVLMSPPIKRSALRAGEPWNGNTSSGKTTEDSELEAEESSCSSSSSNEEQELSASSQEELRQSLTHAGQQKQHQQTAQLFASVSLPHYELTSLQKSASSQPQQHLTYCRQELQPTLHVLHQKEIKRTDTQECHVRHPGPTLKGIPDSSLEVQQQRQLQQFSTTNQPLLHNQGGNAGSATSPQSPLPNSLSSAPLMGSSYKRSNEYFGSTSGGTPHDSADQQCLHVHGRTAQRQVVSPLRDRPLQLSFNDNHSAQHVTASQQSPVSWTAWYHHAQQQHPGQQRQLLDAQQHVASARPGFPKVPMCQRMGPHRSLFGLQQRGFQPHQQAPKHIEHLQQEEPPYGLRNSQHQQSVQAQFGQLQPPQQRHWLGQKQHATSPSANETGLKMPSHPVQLVPAAFPQEWLHEQLRESQHYQGGFQLPALRSVTPPAATTVHKNKFAAIPVHTRSNHFLPRHQPVPWHESAAQASTQFTQSSGSNVPFFEASATQDSAPCKGTDVQPLACTSEIDVSSHATQEKMQAVPSKMGEGAVVNGGRADTFLQLLQLEKNPAPSLKEMRDLVHTSKKANTRVSAISSDTGFAETYSRDTKEHRKSTTSSQIARVADSAARAHPDAARETPASAPAERRSLRKYQGTSPQRTGAPCNDLYSYTPRWGRTRQAEASRSATVAPASLPSPGTSTHHLRSLLAVSAPPRSCAAAATVRRQVRNLAVPAGCEQQRQQKERVQQTTHLTRVGRLEYAHQQDSRRPQQHEESLHAAAVLPCQFIEQSNKGGCVRTKTIDANDACGIERLSCFSFGYNGGPDCMQSRHISNSDLTLFSDRLSAGSVHDVELVSQRANRPEPHSGNAPLVPSANARQVLNKLFLNSSPPRVVKGFRGEVLTRTPETAAARVATTKPGAAGEPTCSTGTTVATLPTGAPVETTAASVAPKASVARTMITTDTARSPEPSPKALCRHRQLSDRARFQSQCPILFGTSTAAVAAAAAAWRSRLPEKDLQGSKASTDVLLRGEKTTGGCTRRLLPDTGRVEHRGQDSNTRKVIHVHSHRPCPMLPRIRTVGHSGATGRKTQKLSDTSARKGFSSSPRRTPKIHVATCSRKDSLRTRATARKVHGEERVKSPPRSPGTAGTSAGRTGKAVDTDAEQRSNKDQEKSKSNEMESASSNITDPETCRAAVEESPVILEKRHDEKCVSPRARSAEVCSERKALTAISTCENKIFNPSLVSACSPHSNSGYDTASPYNSRDVLRIPSQRDCAQGPPPFLAMLQTATASTPDFPTPPASPSGRAGSSTKFTCGPTLNAPSCAPEHRLVAPAAVAATAQPPAYNGPLWPRYWSPPCRVPDASWRSCSSSERAFLGRQAIPQLLVNSSYNQQASSALNGKTGYCPTVATQQRPFPSTVTQGGVVPSGASLNAKDRYVYATRQQTPPPSAVYPAARGMGQNTPLRSGMPAYQQLPCNSSKPQVSLPVGSTSGDTLVYTFATAAGRRFNPSQFSGALHQHWGSAVVPGISAAASAAACHVQQGPVHARMGTGFNLFSFSNQR